MNFRNPMAGVLPVEKDFTDESKYTVEINLMDLNFCSPTMSSFDPCLAEVCKLKWDQVVFFKITFIPIINQWI